jgi:predicted ABC-type ATPase
MFAEPGWKTSGYWAIRTVLLLTEDRPIFFIVAGPNGSGKSTAYTDTEHEFLGKTIWIVNPDVLAAKIAVAENKPLLEANLDAVCRIEAWLDASIQVHKSVGVETVLSTPKYRRLVSLAKSRGFAVWLIYVVLDTVDINIARVKARVAKGGHHVPTDKIISRRENSLNQLPWFLAEADRAWVYDNSGASMKLTAKVSDSLVSLVGDVLPEIKQALNQLSS